LPLLFFFPVQGLEPDYRSRGHSTSNQALTMGMTDLQSTIILAVFAGVILAIAFNVIDMMLAALLGVSILTVAGIFTQDDILNSIRTGGSALALLFGGMVVARTLEPTGVFENFGTRFLRLTRGDGRRFLLGMIVIVTPLCAFMPNATTVILLAPIIIRTARALEVDFVGPMIFAALISNSAGLLTLVGDPVTLLIGASIGMTFIDYLNRVSFGAGVALLILIPLMPLVMKDIWRTRRTLPAGLKPKPLERPVLCGISLAVLAAMILMFLIGEYLPVQIVPPAVAIIAASLALLVVYGFKVEPLEQVLKDLDWKTLVFLQCMFCMVEGFTKTGLLQSLAQNMNVWFGANLLVVSLVSLAGVGVASSLLANIPIVAAMLLLIKGYFVVVELVPEEALGLTFSGWPAASLPVFVGMMFGATYGGNATLIGASANVVTAAICAANGQPVGFGRFMRYGLPVALAQMAISAVYVLFLVFWLNR
jgi:Na+/H+ antiporter NhaD/arsenite permease-like protein